MIRMYDAQENSETTLRLIKQHRLDIKVVLGAWLSAEVSNPDCPWHPEPYSDDTLAANKKANAQEIAQAIRLANAYPEIAVAVAVGNEALVAWNDHMVPLAAVIDYVRTVKAGVAQPVTVADNHDWWARHGAPLTKELDFVSVHIYPLWDGKDIDVALEHGVKTIKGWKIERLTQSTGPNSLWPKTQV